jgi:peptide deformylase
LKIVTYPHPTLRHQSKPVQQVDRVLREMVREMFELMYEANGVGLAANQVDLPFRLFVMNLTASPDEGEEHVIINPVISRPRGNEEKEEGCLSLPGIYGPVIRPAKVCLNAFTLSGEEIDQEISGLMARVVQHETDHLDGVLFVDRLSAAAKMDLETSLEQFLIEYDSHRERPTDKKISQRLHQLERQYC